MRKNLQKKLLVSLAALGMLANCSTVPTGLPGAVAPKPVDAGVFFDDFNYSSLEDLAGGGWIIRTKPGLPGLSAAHWGPETVSVADDPDQPGNRVMRMAARTDGTADGTYQSQVCHQRKYLEGTYATRVHFSDVPTQGPDGDSLVQTFYVISPLRYGYDPKFSELDWEYLPNGGWGDPKTRIYSTSWQTIRIEPWDSFNHAREEKRTLAGWHILMMQVADGKSRFFLDGAQIDESGGRNYPVVPMSINFNIWYIANGLLPDTKAPRAYNQDVDWVFHAKDRVMSPAEVDAYVSAARKAGTKQVDSVPAAQPALASACDF